MAEGNFDPETRMGGGNWFRYGDIKEGGDCWNGIPAVYIRGVDREELPEDHDHRPRTMEEFEEYGAILPDVIEREVLRDVEIGCENFQELVAAGVEVTPCLSCPLLKDK
jgi:hypothetical protein